MSDPLSRKNYQERLTSPDQLDRLLIVVTPKGRLAILLLALLLIGLATWATTASLPVEVSARGLVNTPAGFYIVRSESQGSVNTIKVRKGDNVEAGDVVATLLNQSLLGQLNLAQQQVVALSEQKAALQQEHLKQQALSDKITSQLLQLVESLKAEVAKNPRALDAQSLLPLLAMQLSTQETLSTLVEEVTSQRLYAVQAQWEEAQMKLKDLTAQADLLTVRTPVKGTVIQVDVTMQEWVERGKDLLSIGQPLNANENLMVYGYIPLSLAGVVKVGQKVDMTVVDSGPQQGTRLKGTIAYVSPYSLSEAELTGRLLYIHGSAILPQKLEHVMELQITLDTPYDIANSPTALLVPGLICDLKIVVESIKPWQYLIPVK